MFKLKCIFSSAVLVMAAIAGVTATVDGQIYGGRATGVTASVNNNGTVNNYVFADTGQLPPNGGNITISAPSSLVPGVMSTGVLTASTSGALRSSQSVTVANDVDISVGGVRIRANRATANSGCICCPGVDLGTCSGSSTFNVLTITDQSGNTSTVAATGDPNQVVQLPGGVGTLTLNQQIVGDGSITVNAMRVNASSGGVVYDLIVATASSSLECIRTAPTPADATVSGRVVDAAGRAISRALVSMTDSSGTARTTYTNSLGYFSFTEVESGESYIIQASARGYTFQAQVVEVLADTTVTIRAN